MKTTTNYGFKQPEGTDIVNIDDISDNFGSVDTEIKKANDKVIAHEGKGGSVHADVTTTNSGFMSSSDKVKLNGVATNANNYAHPTGDGNLHVPATGTSNNGKVLKAGSTAGSLAWGTLTPTDVGALATSHEGQGGTVHADVTTTVSGFMSAADKTKLNGIATGAQTNQNAVQSIQAVTSSGTAIGTATAASATDTIQLKEGSNIDIAVSGKTLTLNNTYSYTHPTSDGNLHVPATGTSNSGKVLKAGATAGSLEWGTLTSTDVGALATSHEGQGGSVHADVTTSASGFMSAADKTKLNGIAAGAQTNQNAVQSIQAVTSSGAAIGTATAASATDTIQLKEGSNIDIAVSGKVLTLNNTYSYTHPTGDGNVHVPATGTTNNGKVLKAGATANSASWGQVAWSEVTGIPSSFPGSVTGNAATATRLANARTVSLSGDATGSVSFDGSANANITVTVVDDSHNHIIANVDGLQSALDGKSATSHTHSYLQLSGGSVNGQITSSGLNAPWMELRSNGGTPFIDFSNDNSIDYDARIVLNGNDSLEVQGANLNVRASMAADGDIQSGGNTQPAKDNVQWLGQWGHAWATIITFGVQQQSDRNKKYQVNKIETNYAYDVVKDMDIYLYKYIPPIETDDMTDDQKAKVENAQELNKKEYIMGVMADEAPIEIINHDNGKSINLYSYTTMVLGALQETMKRIEILEDEVKRLGGNI